MSNNHHRIVIVGGGTAGISCAARLMRVLGDIDIAIVEPATKHYYQPLWTLVGAGVMPRQESERDESLLIPSGVKWIKESVVKIDPDRNSLRLSSGTDLGYDYLIMAAGLQIDWHKVKGLQETIGRNGVCSNYAYDQVDYTWQQLSTLQKGKAIFTQPNTPVKCGGAPQKIAYLADDQFRLR